MSLLEASMSKIILAYIPVLHDGYRRFIERHVDADCLYLFGRELITDFPYLRKEIRALSPEQIKQSLAGWGLPFPVLIADRNTLSKQVSSATSIVVPDEDVCRLVATRYLPKDALIEYDTVFLRWNRDNVLVNKVVTTDRTIERTAFWDAVTNEAVKASELSSDWWRRVGALLLREKEILLVAFNEHLPSPHTPYADGDPRNCFSRGKRIELSTAFHAEAALVAEAARQGIVTDGTDLFVTTFPCPPCAKLIAKAGIKRCFFQEGYAMLDSERIFRTFAVEMIRVCS
jgi:dCMP deaminase